MFTLPLFLYGCKPWTIMIEENSRITGSEMKCMSWIAKYALTEYEYWRLWSRPESTLFGWAMKRNVCAMLRDWKDAYFKHFWLNMDDQNR